ncbi:RNA polymerase sigma-70 factor [Chitinophaga qingshengii]|uniref:RNA polymerase sigma-70 factor n=1 Tax=Chitinophaga qingshengii TaxID=1569794 RepID=A0ABR7TF77_9BACT|nr:RNA polymerase sigma-70 factor [Chitinophaga qingshengii]MBC9928966.1 RNA polymerase sigma-70 factor [Chitinophaga qingshengii]
MSLYRTYTDEALLPLLQDSDETAFNEIYHRYCKLLFAVAANKLNSLADAEEIVQDVFADLWKRRLEITIERSLKSFLAAAVKFQVYSVMARHHRQRARMAGFEPDSMSISPVEEQYNLKVLQEQLYHSTAGLPERCRLVYQLSREDGLSNKEIAAAMAISEKTVENQMTKALRHLRAVFRFLFSFF